MSLCNITRTCPQCAYIGFIEGNYPWIECPECIVENKVKYCTQCNEIYHPKQTCEEAKIEQQRLKDPKHRAEEAMSQATKRYCPHCNLEYQKGDGCNQITCKCGKLSCYLRGQKIEGHSHFGASLGKCELFTSTRAMEQLDRTKRQEAGRKVLAEAGITDEKQIEAMLASPPKKASSAEHVAAAGEGAAPAVNRRNAIYAHHGANTFGDDQHVAGRRDDDWNARMEDNLRQLEQLLGQLQPNNLRMQEEPQPRLEELLERLQNL